MLPALVFEILPVFGFILCASTSLFLWIMRKIQKDTLKLLYSVQFCDFFLGLSLFYAGFHGCFITANTDDNTVTQPFKCLYQAVHISMWCVIDAANLIILILICFDQIVSIVWSKTHKTICVFYINQCFVLLIAVISFLTLQPAWSQALQTAGNATITVSPYCSMNVIFGEQFYNYELMVRQYVPLIGVALLIMAGLFLLAFQLSQQWNFKWSDNNEESERIYFFALTRCFMMLFVVHFPLYVMRKEVQLHDPTVEVILRITYATFMGLTEPIVLIKFFPEYRTEFLNFFLRYSQNTKRTWQSADDPPMDDKTVGDVGLNFGSWYSTAGNIIGEAGVPYEMNADKQKSISFYCNEMEKN